MSRIEKIRIKVEVVSFKTGIDFFIIPGVLKRLFCFQKCSPDEKKQPFGNKLCVQIESKWNESTITCLELLIMY